MCEMLEMEIYHLESEIQEKKHELDSLRYELGLQERQHEINEYKREVMP